MTTDTDEATSSKKTEQPSRDVKADRELILELNFVPTWARQDPGSNPYEHAEPGSRGRSDRRGRDRRSDRRPAGRSGGRPDRRGDGRDQRARSGPGRGGDRGPRSQTQAEPRRYPAPAEREPLPDIWLEVSFVPDPDKLSQLVRTMRPSLRAFPLSQIAELFLLDPSRYRVKVEARGKENRRESKSLYEAVPSKMLFVDPDACLAHLLKTDLENHFEKKSIETEPPKGQFVCVARCRLNGALLGPPNHHDYNNSVRELWHSRYADKPFEDFLGSIETVHDEALIEEWKKSVQTLEVYTPKKKAKAEGEGEGEEEKEEEEKHFDAAEAQAFYKEHVAPKTMRKVNRAVIPSAAARNLTDHFIKQRIHDAWSWENRNYRTLHRALRPALRNMGFFLFKANGGETFVCTVEPRPIDPSQSIETIKDGLEYLSEHPGSTREAIAKALRPEAEPESEKVAEVINPLRWMIERGHVIEFFDGTLAIPSAPARREKRGKKKSPPSKPTAD